MECVGPKGWTRCSYHHLLVVMTSKLEDESSWGLQPPFDLRSIRCLEEDPSYGVEPPFDFEIDKYLEEESFWGL